MEHPPEPWWIDDDGFVCAGTGDDYVTVADTHCTDPAMLDTGTMDQIAERIVACVNACAGVSNERLSHWIDDGVMLGTLLDATLREKSALRALLGAMCNELNSRGGMEGSDKNTSIASYWRAAQEMLK